MTESATPAAYGGEPIQAGLPSPADTSPAAPRRVGSPAWVPLPMPDVTPEKFPRMAPFRRLLPGVFPRSRCGWGCIARSAGARYAPGHRDRDRMADRPA